MPPTRFYRRLGRDAASAALLYVYVFVRLFFFSSRRRHTRSLCDWSSDVCSSDLSPSAGTHQGRGSDMDLQLDGKRALVTGSTAGIGLAVAVSGSWRQARRLSCGYPQDRKSVV